MRAPLGAAEREAVARALAAGAVMAYPTETSYALGGNALDAALVANIFRLKGRGAAKALPVLIDGARGLESFADAPQPGALRLAERFWPGPLTLVVQAGQAIPLHLRDRRGTVALRWSPHPVVAELLAIGGVPLIGTSANAAGAGPSHFLEEVLAAFGAALTLAVDGGRTSGAPPSTLLDTTTRPFRLLREGEIARQALREALGRDFPEVAPE